MRELTEEMIDRWMTPPEDIDPDSYGAGFLDGMAFVSNKGVVEQGTFGAGMRGSQTTDAVKAAALLDRLEQKVRTIADMKGANQ